jgi:hypothetical protein
MDKTYVGAQLALQAVMIAHNILMNEVAINYKSLNAESRAFLLKSTGVMASLLDALRGQIMSADELREEVHTQDTSEEGLCLPDSTT